MMAGMAIVLGEGEPAAGPWQVVPVTELVRMLSPGRRAHAGRPWILAVDGRSGSGKTTLALTAIALFTFLARFLYRRGVFLRV